MMRVSGPRSNQGVPIEGRKIQKWVFDNVFGVKIFSFRNQIISTFRGPTPLGDIQSWSRKKIWAILLKKWPFYSWFSPFALPPPRGPKEFYFNELGRVLRCASRRHLWLPHTQKLSMGKFLYSRYWRSKSVNFYCITIVIGLPRLTQWDFPPTITYQ